MYNLVPFFAQCYFVDISYHIQFTSISALDSNVPLIQFSIKSTLWCFYYTPPWRFTQSMAWSQAQLTNLPLQSANYPQIYSYNPALVPQQALAHEEVAKILYEHCRLLRRKEPYRWSNESVQEKAFFDTASSCTMKAQQGSHIQAKCKAILLLWLGGKQNLRYSNKSHFNLSLDAFYSNSKR